MWVVSEGSKDIFYQIMAYSLSNIVRYSVRYPVVFKQYECIFIYFQRQEYSLCIVFVFTRIHMYFRIHTQ